MTKRVGYATGLEQIRSGSSSELADFDHTWQVMFAFEGPHTAIRMVGLGPIPGEYPSDAVRRLLIDKHRASDESYRSAMAKASPPSGDRCLLCRLTFGSDYVDPNLGPTVITRNRRNRFYCNICDLFIRACPGQAYLTLPVMAIDVKSSREIRNSQDMSPSRYARLLAAFHRRTSAIVQKHLGFVLNTLGDGVIAVWPSGFVPEEIRERRGWNPESPARISAQLALQAAEALAHDSPVEFEGDSLPFRGALDTTEMSLFAVHDTSVLPELEFNELDMSETGMPLIDDYGGLLLGEAGVPGAGGESEFQTGPAATDVAGDAVEFATKYASDSRLSAGQFWVTERTYEVAQVPPLGPETPAKDPPARAIGR